MPRRPRASPFIPANSAGRGRGLPAVGHPPYQSAHRGIRRSTRRGAITLPELLVVVGIIAVVVGLIVPILSHARDSSRRVTCLSNLRQLGLAFGQYNHDEGRLPYPAFDEIPWERSLARYVPLNTFLCPSDAELGPATGSSYDWRDTGVPETTLAGKSLRDAVRSDTVLAFEALPGWHGKGQIGAVFVDLSSRMVSQDDGLADLDRAISGGPAVYQSGKGQLP